MDTCYLNIQQSLNCMFDFARSIWEERKIDISTDNATDSFFKTVESKFTEQYVFWFPFVLKISVQVFVDFLNNFKSALGNSIGQYLTNYQNLFNLDSFLNLFINFLNSNNELKCRGEYQTKITTELAFYPKVCKCFENVVKNPSIKGKQFRTKFCGRWKLTCKPFKKPWLMIL